jgi:hypothetical protein
MCHDFRARCFVNVVQRNQSSPRRPAVRNGNTNREKMKKRKHEAWFCRSLNFFPARLRRRRNRSEKVFQLKLGMRSMRVGRGYQRRNEMNAPLSAETEKTLCCKTRSMRLLLHQAEENHKCTSRKSRKACSARVVVLRKTAREQNGYLIEAVVGESQRSL